MDIFSIEQAMKERICSGIRLEAEGAERFRIFSPYIFPDGDHLTIVLEKYFSKWIITDEGNTMMRLSYDLDEKDFMKGNRYNIMQNTFQMFGIENKSGELIINVDEQNPGDALFSMIQAILRISDISFLSRDRIKSTFLEDFREFVISHVPKERLSINWIDEKNDPENLYKVDYRVNGMPVPLHIFAVQNDDQAKNASITLRQFEIWGIHARSLAVFENQAKLSPKVVAQLTDVIDKPFSSLEANRPRIETFLELAIKN